MNALATTISRSHSTDRSPRSVMEDHHPAPLDAVSHLSSLNVLRTYEIDWRAHEPAKFPFQILKTTHPRPVVVIVRIDGTKIVIAGESIEWPSRRRSKKIKSSNAEIPAQRLDLGQLSLDLGRDGWNGLLHGRHHGLPSQPECSGAANDRNRLPPVVDRSGQTVEESRSPRVTGHGTGSPSLATPSSRADRFP